MFSRRRTIAIYAITLAIVGAAVGYTVGRIQKWHTMGWAGVYFYPELPQKKVLATSGQVVMIYGGSPADGTLRSHDRILAVNGVPLHDLGRLRALNDRLTT